MKLFSVLAVPAALALTLACASSVAQDKATQSAAGKPGSSSATAQKKAVKPTWQGSTQLKSTLATTPAEPGSAKPSTPEVSRAAPADATGYKSCHGKDSDA